MELRREAYGSTPEGAQIDCFTLKNPGGVEARVITYGCILNSLRMPDRNGRIGEITLGFDNLQGYLSGHPYFGALVGRFANRIAGGSFELDGQRYTLACNEKGRNHLHGGVAGFDKKVWRAEELREQDSVGVRFSYTSPDGEEGYPGRLELIATYTLDRNDELAFDYRAETDRATPVNLTNHAYWNLGGAGSGPVYDHVLSLDCSRYLEVDDELIPTGELLPVEGSALDFRSEKAIGEDIGQLALGYDHCFVVDRTSDGLIPIGRLFHPASGRGLEIHTTKPAVQLYTGNFLDGIRGANGAIFDRHGALCLETEHYPDAVNHPGFPAAVLRPGETYHHRTVHRFFSE
ncbi:MAG: galactose mutarotase [Spirochaetales bacterium]|nr:galactose mutarotase [Spirochaetales bacterium]